MLSIKMIKAEILSQITVEEFVVSVSSRSVKLGVTGLK